MTGYDLVAAAAENLWRMKLRSVLTISGVLIAIAAFVSMISFGAGNKKYIDEQFEKFGLLSTIHVFPSDKKDTDSTKAAVLNDSTLMLLSSIPGVRLAYPFESFPIEAKLGDSVVNTNAQAISFSVAQTKALSQYQAGARFDNDSAKQVVVTKDFLGKMGIGDPDSIVGTKLVVTAKLIRIDSALVALIRDKDGEMRKRLQAIEPDSLLNLKYARQTPLSKIDLDSLVNFQYGRGVLRQEAIAAMERFARGMFEAREVVVETLTVTGVLARTDQSPMRMEQVIMPIATARRMNSGDISVSPAALLGALEQGTMPNLFSSIGNKSYPKITLDLDPHTPYTVVRDSVKALGFKPHSFADQLGEIQKFLIYFDMALGLIGLIALTTASLGITNTMIMSILERRREIGVLKALGADDSAIRRIFLYEAGTIGAIGAALGVLFGWAISRAASNFVQYMMKREGLEPLDLFAVPWWLIAIAMGFGIVVSLIAGYYPARRAARLDPVESLRNE